MEGLRRNEGRLSTSLDGSQLTGACAIPGGTYTVGPTGTYTTLTAAIAAINANGITGPIVLELQAAYTSGAETFPITLNALPCLGAVNTLTIRPETGATGLTITSANTTATIDINGGNYITIDGRPGGTGAVSQLTIANTATGTTGGTIRFINDAHHNTVTYCTVTGVSTATTAGNILFSTTTGTLGNSDNTISNNTIRDGATTPTNGVLGIGTAGFPNNNNTITGNNIFNFYNSTSTTNGGVGVNIGANNSNWVISNNSLYQTATRTTFGAAATFNGILISSNTVNGTLISGNYIGGTAPNCGGTAMTLNTTATLVFRGIQMTVGTTTATSVQGNTIQNIAITTASTSTAQSLISAVTGNINIGTITGNTLGSQSVTGSVTFVQSTTSTAPFFCGIIAGTGTPGVINISNNTIGGLAVSNSSTGTVNTRGISFQGAATSYTISGNIIGSLTTPNSITNATNNLLAGIVGNSTSLSNTISNNTIANLTHNSTGTGAQLVGMITPGSTGGAFTITGNTVRNLASGAPNTGTGTAASVIGISQTAATTAGQTVSQNTVHTISNTNVGANNVTVTGIHYAGPTTGTNVVQRNLVYGLSMSSTGTAPLMYGMNITSGLTNYQNNMIAIGTSVSANIGIFGINDGVGTNNFYFNSVYIGGPGGFSGSLNTFAFNSSVTVNTRAFQNNIFVNARANAGAGRSYAVQVSGTAPNPSGLTINYNDYYTTGAGTVLGRFNAIDQVTIAAWRTAVGQDLNSISGNPQFIDPTNATPDLHIHPTNPTEIEGVGLAIGAVTDDYDGQVRASFTPTDLGADAGNFVPADFTAPVITYTLLGNTTCLTDVTLSSAAITDVSGVNITPGTRPRLYFKKSTNANTFNDNTNGTDGWKYVEATGVGGSPFSFTTNYSLLFGGGGVTGGDVIQYFVVAQDNVGTPNVGINSGTFSATPASVALTAAAFPIGGTINSYAIAVSLPTSITIGAAGTYPTLTGAGGLFAAINANALSGNTTVSILDAAITETGANSLNPLNFACGGGPYTLLIKPNTGVTTVLSGDFAGALININGADNVTFDGSNNGSTSKDMTIRNINTGGQTFRFINEATGNTIKNTFVEGANSSTTSGTIVFSTVISGTTGNSGNTLTNCDIRDRSDAAGVPANAIYSSGSAGGPNANNTVSGCNVFNWTNAGVLVSSTGAGNGWTINPSNFYQTAARTTAMIAISIQGGSGHSIINNSIGGTAPNAGGSNLSTSSTFRGIDLTVGTASATSVQGNTIRNIRSTTTGFIASYGIFLQAGLANIGNITGNTVGSANTAERFEINGDSYGIRVISTSTVNLSNNTVNNFGTNATPPTGQFYFGISVEGTAGAHTVVNNTVLNVTNASTPDASFSTQTVGLNITATGIQTVRGNTIRDIGSTSIAAPTTLNNRVWGLIMSGTGVGSVVEKNYIYNLYGSSAGAGARADVITLLQSQSLANATYSNNFIANGTINPNSDRFVFGILDLSATPSVNNYYFNSVNITGTATGANNTYAFNRNSTATVDIKNNIFSNSRTGGPGFHVAIANTNAAATGWAATASNYNDLYSATSSTVAQWLGTALANNRTLTGWKAAQGAPTPGSGGDANSFSEAPAFVSAINLHIPNATATQLESGGTPAGGITTDFDNETRPGPTNTNGGGTQVDVGADEFDGTPASAMTYVSSTTTQTNTSTVGRGSTNQQVIGIEIVTTGTVTPLDVSQFNLNTNGTTAPATDITNARLWYTGTSSTFATTAQYGTTVAAPNGAFSISGTQALSTGTNYFWLTYDVPCGAVLSNVIDAECNVVTIGEAQIPTIQAPTGSRTIGASAGLSGTVTIGAAGTYPSITGTGGLFAAINTNGLSGNLTANIVDASVTEPGTIALNAITGVCGGPFTLTIKPNATATLTGTVGTGAIIKLNGADNVTIDGSNSGGTDRSLTIQNTTTTNTGNAVIWLASPASGNGANGNTIKNCIIEGNSATTTLTGVHIGGSTTIGITAAGTELNNNNTITNNLFRKTQYGATLFGFAAASPDQNNVISNNNFGTAVTGEGHSLLAINADRQTGLVVSGNEVQNVVNATTTSSTPFGGIRLLDFKNGLCFNNKVHDLAYTGTSTPKIYGIAMTNATYTTVGNPSNAQIYNNIVYRINSTGTSAVWNLTGILASAGYGDKIYYNSVHLTGQLANSSSGLAAAFANGDANITSVGTNIDVRNNSFSITGSSAVAGGNFWAYYTQATTLAGSVLNNNDLYAAGTNVTNNIGRFNATNYTTLAAWQVATAQDANSISADPQYNAVNNLVPQLGSPLVNAGTPIAGITTDILGAIRNVATPTIGAYETAADAVGPTITYTPLTSTCVTGSRTLTASITDASGVPIAGAGLPVLYWRINAGAWNAATGVFVSGSNYDFTFGSGAVTTDAVQYYIVAQDGAGIPNVSAFPSAGAGGFSINPPAAATPPTTPSSYSIQNTLPAGTYTVGSGGNYATLTAAVTAYNTSCLGGPIVFSLTDATYSGSETFPLQINANPDASAVNTLTIRPATGVAATVTASTSSIFKLNGADYVIIDGINTGGSSLTLSNTNTVSGTTVVWIGSLGAGAGATNDTLRNCTMLNGTLGSSTVVNFGVFVGQTSGAANGEDNDNIAITGNTIRNCVIGIQSIGGATAGQQNDNTFIDNNIIGDAVAASSIGRYGINVGQSTNATVSRNTIQNVVTSDNAISASNNATGIIISTGATNSVFTRNKITGVRYTGTSGYGGKGFDINTGNTASNVTVSNNFVADILGDGWNALTSDAIIGIRITGTTGGINLYHNSVNLGSGTYAGNTSGTQTAALFINSAVTSLDIRNNILVNNLDNSNATDKSWAINSAAANTAFTSVNYNDYSVSGTAGILGFLTADQATLAEWQTATGQDVNSLNVAPVFVSATDLHLVPGSNCGLHRKGTPIAGITVDIDGELRHATYPDMGADEFALNTTGTMTWNGSVSTNWFDVRNWTVCELPGPTSNVVIPTGMPNYPVITGGNPEIRSLSAQPGSSVTVTTGFDLKINN